MWMLIPDALANCVLQPVADDDFARRTAISRIERGDRFKHSVPIFGADAT